MSVYKSVANYLCASLFCLVSESVFAISNHQPQTRFSHLDSDALWLLKSPKQTHFKDTQKYKLKAFLNIGLRHDEFETGTEFEIKNARLPVLFKWSDSGYAKINIGLEPLSNRFGPSFTDASLPTPNIVRQNDTNLFDAWIQHNFSNAARIRVGQDFVPYGLDTYTPSSLLRWSNPSNWAAQISARTKLHRDVGMQLYGQLGQINYGIALLQGNGISRRDTGTGPGEFRLISDNNDKKDLAARLVWASPIEGLTIGTSIYRGKQGDDDPASYLSIGGITDEQHTGMHTEYNIEQWFISLEYNYSSIDNMIVPRSDGILIRSGRGKLNDTTVSLRYKFSKLLEPKFRYERFDTSSDIGNQGDADRIKGFAAPHNSFIMGMNFNISANKGNRNLIMIEYIRINELNSVSEADNDRIEFYWKLSI